MAGKAHGPACSSPLAPHPTRNITCLCGSWGGFLPLSSHVRTKMARILLSNISPILLRLPPIPCSIKLSYLLTLNDAAASAKYVVQSHDPEAPNPPPLPPNGGHRVARVPSLPYPHRRYGPPPRYLLGQMGNLGICAVHILSRSLLCPFRHPRAIQLSPTPSSILDQKRFYTILSTIQWCIWKAYWNFVFGQQPVRPSAILKTVITNVSVLLSPASDKGD
ncbi:hypothetical protein [Absidia glauca]|uniref:Uncharacterized protein n=1 Tax=Absidia glauca TaxID=4829 RepID=A0A168LHN3_ABSGL|nr:hypothetical protein [Absidia glauca]